MGCPADAHPPPDTLRRRLRLFRVETTAARACLTSREKWGRKEWANLFLNRFGVRAKRLWKGRTPEIFLVNVVGVVVVIEGGGLGMTGVGIMLFLQSGQANVRFKIWHNKAHEGQEESTKSDKKGQERSKFHKKHGEMSTSRLPGLENWNVLLSCRLSSWWRAAGRISV